MKSAAKKKARNHFENYGFYLPRKGVFLADLAQLEHLKSKRSLMSDAAYRNWLRPENVHAERLMEPGARW